MAETMFERSGRGAAGAKASRIVSAFYDSVLDSPILAPYFDGIREYVYDNFGAVVNLPARLEALSDPMQIVPVKTPMS